MEKAYDNAAAHVSPPTVTQIMEGVLDGLTLTSGVTADAMSASGSETGWPSTLRATKAVFIIQTMTLPKLRRPK
jgi:hypothetical protein